jgi:D-3-phosphoglycerate dehydrogenase / 2-oxoglutarate reductase
MSLPRALVTAPLRGPALERLRQLVDVEYDPWIEHRPVRVMRADQLAERLQASGAVILICEADQAAGPVLELPLIAIGSTRGDPTNVDVAGASAAGIPVLHTPGRNADAVAEMTVALLFAVGRHVVAGDRDMRAGTVFGETLPYQRYRAWQMAGRTIGLVGYGAVGRAVAWRMAGLGMKVITTDPYAPDATHSLDALLAEADVVSMHAAVTPATVGLIGAGQFAAMPAGALYLNTARAGLHDTDALVDALASGHLAGAGLDHVNGEVLPRDHPLCTMDNVVITPHIGGATYDVEINQTAMIVDDLGRVLRGERPSRCANPEVFG